MDSRDPPIDPQAGGEVFGVDSPLRKIIRPKDGLLCVRTERIQSYGIGPATSDEGAINYGGHSDAERLPESSLYPFVEFTGT
jgi:hypothetical protein